MYYNRMIQGFVASDTRTIVYLKQCDETGEFAVKVMQPDGTKTIVVASYSLSTVLREFAETIAQFTGGFTAWRTL